MRELFAEEIAKVDPDFYHKLDESAYISDDKKYGEFESHILGKEYHDKYPTVHHLIMDLMASDEKPDIRHLYMACAWLVAHRGHFLNDIQADNVENLTDIHPVYNAFMQWFDDNGYSAPWECNADEFAGIICRKMRISEKEKEVYALAFGGKKPKDDADEYPFSRSAIVKLLCGGSIKAAGMFIADASAASIEGSLCLDNPENTELAIGELGDNGELLRNMSALYDCAVLSKILSGCKCISEQKINEYNTHKTDLRQLKYLIKKYCPEKYNAIFRKNSDGSYEAYAKTATKKEEFYKSVKSVLKLIAPDCTEDQRIADDIALRLDDGTYMPKQINTDNRVIPHQLYFGELRTVLKNAAKHYDFLQKSDDDGITVSQKAESIFTFRIPYFVGPLNSGSKNSWIVRKSEQRIYPWNFSNVVDYDKCEQAFIRKMTNQCSYLPGEDVVPKNSILYCRFNVLNEINNIKIDSRPISAELKQRIFNELFMPNGGNRAKVTKKRLTDYLISESIIGKNEADRLSGIDINIKSSMKPLFDFHVLMSSGKLSENDAENIILHSTYIENRSRFLRWLRENYTLDESELKYISGKKYSDFGRLSKTLLNGITGTNLETGEVGTIMHFMWHTNDNFMQIAADKTRYTFFDEIKRFSDEYYAQHKMSVDKKLDDMYVSNSVKRPILRTLDIVSDIVKIRGGAPEKIFVEVTRSDIAANKGKRTSSRRDTLTECYRHIKSGESDELLHEIDALGDNADNRLQSEKLFLYYQQMGKCMYCGKRLDPSLIGTEEYNVDHIWPQAYIKDDSIHNNKVLVHSKENGIKGDRYPIDAPIRNAMHDYWKHLADAKLIGEEKYKRLTRSTGFTDAEKIGFINRQLVETSQSVKAVAKLLESIYPNTKIVYVKAGHVSEFRHNYGDIKERALGERYTNEQKRNMQLVKCRSINDVHHANDAYLNVVVGNVYDEKFTAKWFNVSTDKYSLNYKSLFGYPLNRAPEAWNPAVHLPNVDRAMNNKYVHITKYQTKQKGGLFDQNPLPAGNASLIPRKQGLDPVKYGGYNKPSASFFVLVRYISGKKRELTLVAVDLLVADKFLTDVEFAHKYVSDKLGSKAKEIEFPLGGRIIKINTVFSADGLDVCLSGKMNGGKTILFRSLTTSFYSSEQVMYIKRIDRVLEKCKENKNYIISEKYDGIDAERNIELLRYLCKKANEKPFDKLFGAHPTLDESACEKFAGADILTQAQCLANIVAYIKTNRAGTMDLSIINGSKNSGSILASANISNWKYDDIRIIDRSASGLYESRSINLRELL